MKTGGDKGTLGLLLSYAEGKFAWLGLSFSVR